MDTPYESSWSLRESIRGTNNYALIDIMDDVEYPLDLGEDAGNLLPHLTRMSIKEIATLNNKQPSTLEIIYVAKKLHIDSRDYTWDSSIAELYTDITKRLTKIRDS